MTVLADVDKIIGIVPVTPAQYPRVMKTTVTTEHDADIRPVLPDKARQNSSAVPAIAAAACAQVTGQKVATTEHVQREVAIVVIVAIEELAGPPATPSIRHNVDLPPRSLPRPTAD